MQKKDGCDELPAKFFKDNFAILENVVLDICNSIQLLQLYLV